MISHSTDGRQRKEDVVKKKWWREEKVRKYTHGGRAGDTRNGSEDEVRVLLREEGDNEVGDSKPC
jgi:hypothetical protein